MVLHAMISWGCFSSRDLRIWHREANVLSIAMRSESEVFSMAMVMWYVGRKGRSLMGGVVVRLKLGRGIIWWYRDAVYCGSACLVGGEGWVVDLVVGIFSWTR
jgi:hypothetical protein